MNELVEWDQLLQRYVDVDGRVDYDAWKKQDQNTLHDWLAKQSAQTKTRQEHLAHWINLYNAFTIKAVLKAYPISSIRPTIMRLPNWFAFLRFFQQPTHQLGGNWFSLAQIENTMLRQQGDPRIHFAIVCASVGCPLLRNQAYRPEQVEQQLEDDLNRFINNPNKVRFDHEHSILYCSKIFKWYRADFLRVNPSLSGYILPHLRSCASQESKPRLVFLPYDWSLNQRTSS
jgi:hypothetical protein